MRSWVAISRQTARGLLLMTPFGMDVIDAAIKMPIPSTRMRAVNASSLTHCMGRASRLLCICRVAVAWLVIQGPPSPRICGVQRVARIEANDLLVAAPESVLLERRCRHPASPVNNSSSLSRVKSSSCSFHLCLTNRLHTQFSK